MVDVDGDPPIWTNICSLGIYFRNRDEYLGATPLAGWVITLWASKPFFSSGTAGLGGIPTWRYQKVEWCCLKRMVFANRITARVAIVQRKLGKGGWMGSCGVLICQYFGEFCAQIIGWPQYTKQHTAYHCTIYPDWSEYKAPKNVSRLLRANWNQSRKYSPLKSDAWKWLKDDVCWKADFQGRTVKLQELGRVIWWYLYFTRTIQSGLVSSILKSSMRWRYFCYRSLVRSTFLPVVSRPQQLQQSLQILSWTLSRWQRASKRRCQVWKHLLFGRNSPQVARRTWVFHSMWSLNQIASGRYCWWKISG